MTGPARHRRRILRRSRPIALASPCCWRSTIVGGMLWLHEIDDDPEFALGARRRGRPRAVAVAAELIDREIDTHRWTANDPFFCQRHPRQHAQLPAGIIQALRRFTLEMTDQVARTRGSSQTDPDLEPPAACSSIPARLGLGLLDARSGRPRNRIAIPRGDRGVAQIQPAAGRGPALFDTRADNLLATLERMAKDIGSSSAALDQQVEEHRCLARFRRGRPVLPHQGRALRLRPALARAREGFRGRDGGARAAGALGEMLATCSPPRVAAMGRRQRRAGQPAHPAISPPRASSCCAGAPSLGNHQHPAQIMDRRGFGPPPASARHRPAGAA